jgi:hypothetical protein
MFVLGATAQIVLITVVMSPLTYAAAAANFPLQDANLLAIDRALGLDWAAYVAFVNEHPVLAAWLSYGYRRQHGHGVRAYPILPHEVGVIAVLPFVRAEQCELSASQEMQQCR